MPQTDMFREELEEFADAIRGDAKVEVSLEEAVRALAVVEAVITSSRREGRSVAVEPLLAEVIVESERRIDGHLFSVGAQK